MDWTGATARPGPCGAPGDWAQPGAAKQARPARNRRSPSFDMSFRCLSVLRRPCNTIGYQLGLISCQYPLALVVTQLVLDGGNCCPPQKRAASTKPIAPNQAGFVAAVPPRVFRDGTGIFTVKLSHYPCLTIDSACPRSAPPRARPPPGGQVCRELQRGPGASPRAPPQNRASESPRSPVAQE